MGSRRRIPLWEDTSPFFALRASRTGSGRCPYRSWGSCNWGRTSAHAHAPVPSGRVPMWAIEVLLHRLPRFECSSVFSHLDIHDRVDQCVLTPGYPVVPHQRLSCTVGSSPPLLGWRPGEGANCAISIGDIPHFPGR